LTKIKGKEKAFLAKIKTEFKKNQKSKTHNFFGFSHPIAA